MLSAQDSQKWSDPSYPSIMLDTKVYWSIDFFRQLEMMLAAHQQPKMIYTTMGDLN